MAARPLAHCSTIVNFSEFLLAQSNRVLMKQRFARGNLDAFQRRRRQSSLGNAEIMDVMERPRTRLDDQVIRRRGATDGLGDPKAIAGKR